MSFGHSASAESIIIPVEPMSYGPQCEAQDDTRIFYPVVDAGGARVVQRWQSTLDGKKVVGFFFLDCSTARGIGIKEVRPAVSPESDPYRITRQTTVGSLADLAAERGDDSVLLNADETRSDWEVDEFCGCRKMYPNSVGARRRLTN